MKGLDQTEEEAWTARQFAHDAHAVARGVVPGYGNDLRVRDHTPRLLQELGIPDKPWYHARSHVVGETGHVAQVGTSSTVHAVPEKTLLRLPELVEHPVLVGENGVREAHAHQPVLVLDELDAGGLPIFACLDLEGHPKTTDGVTSAVFVTSVHGKENALTYLFYMGRRGKVGFVDRLAFSRLMSRASLWVPSTLRGKDGLLDPMPWMRMDDAAGG